MAATVESILTAGQSTVNADSFATASVDVLEGDELIIGMSWTKGTAALGFPNGINGLGATWAAAGATMFLDSSRRGRFMRGTVPADTSGVVNIDFGADHDGCIWTLIRLATAAAGPAQSAKVDAVATNDPSVDFAAASAADSLILAIVTSNNPSSPGVAKSGWTELDEQGYTSSFGIGQWVGSHAGGITTVAPVTLTQTPNTSLLALEIPAAGIVSAHRGSAIQKPSREQIAHYGSPMVRF